MPQDFTTPLCVDLDGTLVRTNTLLETAIAEIKRHPFFLWKLLITLPKGKAATKHLIGQAFTHTTSTFPYNEPFLAWLKKEHTTGRTILLTTASDSAIATHIAKEIGIFSQVIASSLKDPISANAKYTNLCNLFGEKGFSYAGNSRSDVSVWKCASSAVIVNAPKHVSIQAKNLVPVEQEFSDIPPLTLQTVGRAARVHQWVKNLLIFVPALAAHEFANIVVLTHAGVGFLSFSLFASYIYIMNDLFDIASDRAHHTKRNRPIAAGHLSIRQAVILALVLAVTSIILSLLFLPISFTALLFVYAIINIIYSIRAKKIPYLDTVILAGLYVLRILAGGAATTITTSSWLLLFAGWFFLNLALIKRVIELRTISEKGSVAHGRGYTTRDTELVTALGLLCALFSCIVLGLYIGSSTVHDLYTRPGLLWLLIPLVATWIIRMWYLALARKLPDDPVLFASKDIGSYLFVVCLFAIMLIAI